MIEIVFGESACGSLKIAQTYGKGMLKRTKNKMLSTMPFISAYLLLLIDEQVIQSVTNRNGITIRLIFSWTFQPLGLVLLPVFLAITTLLLLRLNRTYDIF